MLKIAMGGTVIPSAATRARRRAALPCQKMVRAKKSAWELRCEVANVVGYPGGALRASTSQPALLIHTD
jgi:hypothetical protein